MGTVVSRVILGVLAAVAVGSGAIAVMRAVVYVGFDERIFWTPALDGSYAVAFLAGAGAVVLYVTRAAYGPLMMRISIGFMIAAAGALMGRVVPPLVSEITDVTKGTASVTLEEGLVGFLWLSAGAYVLWRVLSRRWPETQPLAVPGSGWSN